MLLHSALLLLTQKEMAARKESSNLGGMRKQAMSLRKDFDDQRKKSIAKQLQASYILSWYPNKMQTIISKMDATS